jgi:hypothetical protein
MKTLHHLCESQLIGRLQRSKGTIFERIYLMLVGECKRRIFWWGGEGKEVKSLEF